MKKAKFIKFLAIAVVLFFLSYFLTVGKIFAEEGKIWIDTSHWEIQNSFIADGYWKSGTNTRWVDTSYVANSGYWSSDSYQVWVDTSHWQNSGYWLAESYNVLISSGYFAVSTYDVYVSSGYTSYTWVNSGYWNNYTYKVWVPGGYRVTVEKGYWKIVEEYGWGINRQFPLIGSAGHAQWVTYHTFIWVDTSHYETRYSSSWVDTSHWQSSYVNTSHWEKRQSTYWVDTSHWETRQRSVWKDTGFYLNSGHWETRFGSHWVDTSRTISLGYRESYTTNIWVDTSYSETKKVWISSGYFADPMHGEVVVEKYPKYVFTKWHEDSGGKEASMLLDITWKVDNSLIIAGEDKRKINRIYIYEDVIRYSDKGIDKVVIYDGNVAASEEGTLDFEIKFDYAGNEASMLHVYLYAENGEVGHISFPNPVNGFRSINIEQGGTDTNPDLWLGGIVYEVFKF